MSTFVQLHMLTSYPPANLNRDDLGRPKTAVMGGVQRLRISSQSLKRAWRASDLFEDAMSGHLGIRTKRMGAYVYRALTSSESLAALVAKPLGEIGQESAAAKNLAWKIAAVFVDKPGKDHEEDEAAGPPAEEDQGAKKKGAKKEKKKSNVNRDTLESEQLVFYSTSEIQSIERLIKEFRESASPPDEGSLKRLVSKQIHDADIALFGRMMASSPDKNIEAAAQVAHAISVHRVAVEDDFFSAVDDLNFGVEDVGAGHIGETEFAAGMFYLYVCVNRDLLKENLQGDEALTASTLKALTEAAATVAPTGKQNSFASRAYASYILAEKGKRQPRSLSVAFLKPVGGSDMLAGAIAAVSETREKMDKVYGPLADATEELNAHKGQGDLSALLQFVSVP